jgi:signal transduction histidine kinase
MPRAKTAVAAPLSRREGADSMPMRNAWDTPRLRHCRRCGQLFMPFPVRRSRLCAPCVYAVVTSWPRPGRPVSARADAASGTAPSPARLAEVLSAALGGVRVDLLAWDETAGELRPASGPAGTAVVAGPAARALVTAPRVLFWEDAAPAEPLARLVRGRSWSAGMPIRDAGTPLGFAGFGRRPGAPLDQRERALLETLQRCAGLAFAASRATAPLEAALARASRLITAGTLTASITHEIRNLLVPVHTFLHLLPERMDDPDLPRYRQLCLDELDRVLELASDVLSQQRAVARRAPVAVGPTLEPIVHLLAPVAGEHGVELRLTCEPDVPAVQADPQQLRQIALNLVLNAVDASPAGRPVTVAVRRGVGPSGAPAVALEVHDQGPGIPRAEQDALFTPYFTTREAGTGLGLSIVRDMVAEHGGTMAVESAVGAGTVFRIVLPAATAGGVCEAPARSRPGACRALPRSSGRVRSDRSRRRPSSLGRAVTQ